MTDRTIDAVSRLTGLRSDAMTVGFETGTLAFLVTWMQAEGLGVLVFDSVLLEPGVKTNAVDVNVDCAIILTVVSCILAGGLAMGKMFRL